jgi:hypothetical protein
MVVCRRPPSSIEAAASLPAGQAATTGVLQVRLYSIFMIITPSHPITMTAGDGVEMYDMELMHAYCNVTHACIWLVI